MVGDIAQNDIDNIAKFVALFESFLSNLKDAAGINGLCRDVYSTDDFPADMLNKIQEILDKMYNAYKFLKGLLIEIGDNINGSDQDNDDFEGNINFLIKANKNKLKDIDDEIKKKTTEQSNTQQIWNSLYDEYIKEINGLELKVTKDRVKAINFMNERRIRNAEDEFQNKNLDTNDEIDKAFKKIYLDAIEKFETERKNMHETEHTEMNKKIEEILKTVKDLITVNEKSSNKTLNSINKLLEEINSKGKEAKNSIESFKKNTEEQLKTAKQASD